MLELQKFILDNPDWHERLTDKPFCLHTQSTKLLNGDSYVLFKYDQRNSSFESPIVREARGVILRIKPDRTSKIVRFFTKKFFNIGEPLAAKLDYSSAVGYEKWDGTLVSLWFDEGAWNISTLGNLDIFDAPLNSGGYKNFGELFYEAKKKYKFDFDKLDKNLCYSLELCSPFNQIVVLYDDFHLIHLNTVDCSTLEEVERDIGLPKPKEYSFASKEDYRNLVSTFDSTHEGIVVRDKFNNRIKIKSELYFSLHLMAANGQLTKVKAMNLILHNEVAEFVSYFPKQLPFIHSVELEYAAAKSKAFEVNNSVAKWKAENPTCGRAEFSNWVCKNCQGWSHIAYLAYADLFMSRFQERLTTALTDETNGGVKEFMRFLSMGVNN